MRDVLLHGEADAALAAGIFHSGQYTVGQVKDIISKSGVHIRLL
jgi:imidazole glycerol-phosphate synthase subunit HisF